VAIDTLEALFSGLPNHAVLRSELRRLFGWLKDKKLTTLITGERGEGTTITRQGLEEYVSDCVILLDHRVTEDIATRRLRVVKYRGSTHGTNEYPFLIGDDGISVLPITTLSAQPQGLARTRLFRRAPPRRHAGRQGLLPRQQRPGVGHGRHGQEHAGRRLRRGLRRARGALSLPRVSRNPRTRSCAI